MYLVVVRKLEGLAGTKGLEDLAALKVPEEDVLCGIARS